ncbi:hypothetical protein DE146DRAFT_752206 [Phaeosphaeria sp. MPI-PUGE-AT-0046c]|nr:hypothetical protein DE146DRAFT_752206 [Phaeosphaeria sp. MPI-PUGE-AT-0046c]
MHFSVAFAVTAFALLPGTLADYPSHPADQHDAAPQKPPAHKESHHEEPQHKAPEHGKPEHGKPEHKEPEHEAPKKPAPKKPAPKKPAPEHHEEHKPAHHKPVYEKPTHKLTKPTRYYPTPTPGYYDNISKNGECGGYSGTNCLGSGFGNCCGFVLVEDKCTITNIDIDRTATVAQPTSSVAMAAT